MAFFVVVLLPHNTCALYVQIWCMCECEYVCIYSFVWYHWLISIGIACKLVSERACELICVCVRASTGQYQNKNWFVSIRSFAKSEIVHIQAYRVRTRASTLLLVILAADICVLLSLWLLLFHSLSGNFVSLFFFHCCCYCFLHCLQLSLPCEFSCSLPLCRSLYSSLTLYLIDFKSNSIYR